MIHLHHASVLFVLDLGRRGRLSRGIPFAFAAASGKKRGGQGENQPSISHAYHLTTSCSDAEINQ
jgi:hypothetical protein